MAESGAFSAEQSAHVEELLRAAPKCVQIDMHDNFQAWNIAAVGLAGLALRTRPEVRTEEPRPVRPPLPHPNGRLRKEVGPELLMVHACL